MNEKTGNTDKPEYLFNEAKCLEIYMPGLGRWHRVTPTDFRSFDGKRRLQGELYEGPLYAYGTNRRVIPEGNDQIVSSEVLIERNARSQKMR
jgi:hypothetical protein|tara:strand:- start:3069 stop:3344 length:276 start_codon:yes stop_codon:yes gene_type:complete